MLNITLYIVGVYLIFCGYLYLMQDRLIFLPPLVDKELYERFKNNVVEFKSAEAHAHGWKINQQKQHAKTILYFGGNAEDVVYMNLESERFNVNSVIALNYPGYGKSQGEPGEVAFYKQALTNFDNLLNERHLDTKSVIIMGRSLGSSVASYVASKRNVAGLILVTPFDSMREVANHHYRIFPVSLILKHEFPTTEFIGEVKCPVIILAARNDEIISDKNLQNLERKITHLTKTMRYPGFGHNTIQAHPDYYRDINEFIAVIP